MKAKQAIEFCSQAALAVLEKQSLPVFEKLPWNDLFMAGHTSPEAMAIYCHGRGFISHEGGGIWKVLSIRERLAFQVFFDCAARFKSAMAAFAAQNPPPRLPPKPAEPGRGYENIGEQVSDISERGFS